MARNKYPEITESRILEAATKLFLTKGYEKTTIQDIVDELGDLTRGAVYHHFKSKDEIIDAVCNQMTMSEGAYRAIISRTDLTGLEKFKAFVRMTASADRPEDELNLQLQYTIQQNINPRFVLREVDNAFNDVASLVQQVLEEGNRDGSMTVPYPRETAETFSLLFTIWVNRDIEKIGVQRFIDKIRFLQSLFDALGLPVIDDAYIEECRKLYTRVEQIMNDKLP